MKMRKKIKTKSDHILTEPGLRPEVLVHCCELGQAWVSESRELCGPYPADISVAVRDITEALACTAVIDVCCVSHRRQRQCSAGKQTGVLLQTCDGLHLYHASEDAKVSLYWNLPIILICKCWVFEKSIDWWFDWRNAATVADCCLLVWLKEGVNCRCLGTKCLLMTRDWRNAATVVVSGWYWSRRDFLVSFRRSSFPVFNVKSRFLTAVWRETITRGQPSPDNLRNRRPTRRWTSAISTRPPALRSPSRRHTGCITPATWFYRWRIPNRPPHPSSPTTRKIPVRRWCWLCRHRRCSTSFNDRQQFQVFLTWFCTQLLFVLLLLTRTKICWPRLTDSISFVWFRENVTE